MGILGRRRASKPMEVTTEGLGLLKRQLASPNPALRLLAAEAQTLAFEAKNPPPSRRFAPLKSAEMLGSRGHPTPIRSGSGGMFRNGPFACSTRPARAGTESRR
jgi:hypothetical protein